MAAPLVSALDAVGCDARQEIAERLGALAQAQGVRLLWAAESGSRAWGFHSPDSDYDVRFIYARDVSGYLTLAPPRDVIETPLDGLFDINGWDIAKALRLMLRGNAVVQEWLTSPIVYAQAPGFRAAVEPLAIECMKATGAVGHYFGLLRRQWGTYIEGRCQVRLKKYFYVVRPAAALHWLHDHGEPAPMHLPEILAGIDLPDDVADALSELHIAKLAASELGLGPRAPALDQYVQTWAGWGERARRAAPGHDRDLLARMDGLFRDWVLPSP